MLSVSPLAVENLGKVCENSRAGEITDLLSNSPKRSPRFSPGYEGTENKFYHILTSIFTQQIGKI